MHELPVASNNGCTPEQIRARFIRELTTWLFTARPAEPPLLELTYAGATTPTAFGRRDFLTGAIIDRAVQQAAQEAANAEERGIGQPGVSQEMLMRAFEDQLRSVAAQVTEQTARHFLDLPDGVRVATLRRPAQPGLISIELQRH